MYTKPKKAKKTHKKEKLAVLKYYKVGSDGKVQRTRKECPSEQCGAGIFMATMVNRHYCGKCHLTYVVSPEEQKKNAAAAAKARDFDNSLCLCVCLCICMCVCVFFFFFSHLFSTGCCW